MSYLSRLVTLGVLGLLLLLFLPVGVQVTPEGSILITRSIVYGNPGWISPIGEVLNGWEGPGLAWDEDTVTSSSYDAVKAGWTPYLELTHTAIDCDKVRVWVSAESDNVATVEVDVYYSGTYNNIYSGVPTLGVFVEYTIGSTQSVTAMRIRLLNSHSKQARFQYIHEVDFDEVLTPNITNTPGSQDFGPVSESGTYETGLTYFTVTNNSGGVVSITAQGTNFTGGSGWLLSNDGVPGVEVVGLKAGLEGGDYTIVVKKDSPYNLLVSGLPDTGAQKWGLRLYAPTEFSDGVQKSTTVTLTATLD